MYVLALLLVASATPPQPVTKEVDLLCHKARGTPLRVFADVSKAVLPEPRDGGSRFVARWTIDATGAVKAFSWLDERVGEGPFRDCAKPLLEGLRFPPPAEGETTVSFPLVFEDGEPRELSSTAP